MCHLGALGGEIPRVPMPIIGRVHLAAANEELVGVDSSVGAFDSRVIGPEIGMRKPGDHIHNRLHILGATNSLRINATAMMERSLPLVGDLKVVLLAIRIVPP